MQLDLVRKEDWFPGIESKDAYNRPASPLELLVLGALRVLGRSAIFDDLYEGSFVSAETHRRFFHRFVAAASLRLYPRYVRLPQSTAEVRRAESLYVSVTCMMLCALSACVMCTRTLFYV